MSAVCAIAESFCFILGGRCDLFSLVANDTTNTKHTMKLTFTADRIKLQSENDRESQQVCDLITHLFNGDYAMSDEIANDHGSVDGLNFVSLPLPVAKEAAK